MIYSRIENAIQVCNNHISQLDPTDIKHKEVEVYLVSGLITLIVSEYEEYLESIFSKRAEMCGDEFASNFIKQTLAQKFRSPDLSKIYETLKRFDSSYRDLVSNEIENSPEKSAWDSLMKARHAVVHKKGNLNMTFRELVESYPLTKNVIKKVGDISRNSKCLITLSDA